MTQPNNECCGPQITWSACGNTAFPVCAALRPCLSGRGAQSGVKLMFCLAVQRRESRRQTLLHSERSEACSTFYQVNLRKNAPSFFRTDLNFFLNFLKTSNLIPSDIIRPFCTRQSGIIFLRPSVPEMHVFDL